MQLLEDQFRMLGSKSDSLSQEFDKIRKMVTVVVNERHLDGMDGSKDA